eukprot:104004-Prorocentrum_minimum.AAC.1
MPRPSPPAAPRMTPRPPPPPRLGRSPAWTPPSWPPLLPGAAAARAGGGAAAVRRGAGRRLRQGGHLQHERADVALQGRVVLAQRGGLAIPLTQQLLLEAEVGLRGGLQLGGPRLRRRRPHLRLPPLPLRRLRAAGERLTLLVQRRRQPHRLQRQLLVVLLRRLPLRALRQQREAQSGGLR